MVVLRQLALLFAEFVGNVVIGFPHFHRSICEILLLD